MKQNFILILFFISVLFFWIKSFEDLKPFISLPKLEVIRQIKIIKEEEMKLITNKEDIKKVYHFFKNIEKIAENQKLVSISFDKETFSIMLFSNEKIENDNVYFISEEEYRWLESYF